ncbi:hypothetical protein QTP86_028963 [Hemibagrus guttatus]|nr:hypothetical protein QTP86_028963 [Hemibagrus guttatus]
MATLMRCGGSVYRILEPALNLRISNRYVRTVRRRLPTTSSSSSSPEKDSINLKSGVKNEQVGGAEGLDHACSSALESMPEGNLRDGCQRYGDTTKKVSESHREKTTSKRPSPALSSKQMESLQYEKAQPDDKRVLRLMHLARSKKLREQQGKILLEGRHLISEALEAGASPLTVFFSAVERLQELPVNKLTQASLVKVKLEDVRIWTDLDVEVDMIGKKGGVCEEKEGVFVEEGRRRSVCGGKEGGVCGGRKEGRKECLWREEGRKEECLWRKGRSVCGEEGGRKECLWRKEGGGVCGGRKEGMFVEERKECLWRRKEGRKECLWREEGRKEGVFVEGRKEGRSVCGGRKGRSVCGGRKGKVFVEEEGVFVEERKEFCEEGRRKEICEEGRKECLWRKEGVLWRKEEGVFVEERTFVCSCCHDTTGTNFKTVFKRPEASQMRFSEEKCGKPLPLTLICDNLRDPGNLGVTLRCAAAAGCHSVLLSTGCVDVWEPKVLRAALGAHFRLPIIPSLSWSDIQTRLPPNTTVLVADNSTSSETELELAGAPQRAKKTPGEYGWTSSRNISRKTNYVDEDEVGGARQEAGPVLESQPYHTNWTGSHTAIVIGGETHGLSKGALRLAEEMRGRRLLIPMVRRVDSLNAAMAASVLLFEGRRQLSES